MSFFKSIWGGVKRVALAARVARAVVFARYEAANQRWGERSQLGSALQDARFDVDASTRAELQRRHRYWVANSSIVNRIRCLYIQFSVGVCGLQVTPNSTSEDWNETRQESFNLWARRPCIDNRDSLGQTCIQWAGGLFDDGEVFVYKTRDTRGRPAIQTFEAHRVATPPDYRSNKSVIDGIRYEAMPDGGVGQPISYFVAINGPIASPDGGQVPDRAVNFYREIPANQIVHLFKQRRPGQLRGIPEGVCGMNTLHDYEDLHLLEMQAAKMAAEVALVETNPTGELDVQGTRRARVNITTANQQNLLVTKPSDQFYRVTFGAQKIGMKAGDSLKNFQVERPTIAQQDYWKTLQGQICCAYNVPLLLVFPYSLQGTVARADLDICANAFRFNFEIIRGGLQEIYEWQTGWAVNYDRSMDGTPPSDFLENIIRPPRAPNVDIGYTAQALQLELTMGTKTLQDVYAERQQDWRHQLRQIAETEAYINSLAAEFKIDSNRISQKAKQPAAQPADGDGDEKPEPVPITTTKENDE